MDKAQLKIQRAAALPLANGINQKESSRFPDFDGFGDSTSSDEDCIIIKNDYANIQESKKQYYRQMSSNLLSFHQEKLDTTWIKNLQTAQSIGAIPLQFPSQLTDFIMNLNFDQTQFPRLVYTGYRPSNSLEMHEKFSNRTGSYIYKYMNLVKEKCAVWNKGVAREEQKYGTAIEFNAAFESGNLDAAVQICENEYDCFMRVDSNTKGHLQWYYFTVRNAKRGTVIRFNIKNFTKKMSLYEKGMKPYVFSQKEYDLDNKNDWKQRGFDVSYSPSQFDYLPEQETQYFTLSFCYEFEFNNDEVSFAYCIPYTYSKLINFITYLDQEQKAVMEGNNKLMTEQKLCLSLSGIGLPLLTITDPTSEEIPLAERKIVILTARVHPGESNSSWMMHGFLKFIMGDSLKAIELRERLIFQIVPMLNPDGVILGNYRTGFGGKDLNRKYKTTDRQLFPVIFGLKGLVENCKQNSENNNILAYFDFHGHSIQNNVFIYGPEYNKWQTQYYESKFLPKIIANNTEMFNYAKCDFQILPNKSTTARAVFFKDFKISNCYTMESSFGGYLDSNDQWHEFTQEKLHQQQKLLILVRFMEMGEQVGIAISQYLEMITSYDAIKAPRVKQSKENKISSRQVQSKSFSRTKSILEKCCCTNGQQVGELQTNFSQYFQKLINEIKEEESEQEQEKSESCSKGSDSEPINEDLSVRKIKGFQDFYQEEEEKQFEQKVLQCTKGLNEFISPLKRSLTVEKPKIQEKQNVYIKNLCQKRNKNMKLIIKKPKVISEENCKQLDQEDKIYVPKILEQKKQSQSSRKIDLLKNKYSTNNGYGYKNNSNNQQQQSSNKYQLRKQNSMELSQNRPQVVQYPFNQLQQQYVTTQNQDQMPQVLILLKDYYINLGIDVLLEIKNIFSKNDQIIV